MIDFEYSLEVAKYLIIYPILVITSLSAIYTFLIRTYDNLQKNKSKSLDVRICKCGSLYWEDQKTTKNGINRMEINGNLYGSVNGSSQISDDDVVDKGRPSKLAQTNNNNNNDKFWSTTDQKSKFVNLNNNQNIRSRNDDSIVLKNVHNRHVVSAMKEMFEHNNSMNTGEQSNVRTLSPARTNRTPVKTNLLKYFGEGSPSTIKQSLRTNDDKVQRRTYVRSVNRIKTKSPETDTVKKNRLSQCSISELLDQLNDQTELQELCQEFVETSPRGMKPSEVQKRNSQDLCQLMNGHASHKPESPSLATEPESDPVQLRQKSVSFESLPGSKRLSLYSTSPSSRKPSRPISTENLRRSLSQTSTSLSNPNLNDILTQEIYDAILQSKNFDTAISFDDLLHAEELSRCLSEYSITELLKDSSLEDDDTT